MASVSICAKCEDSLIVEIDDNDDSTNDLSTVTGSSSSGLQGITSVPDDVLLSCGHHLHWDCVMEVDSYELMQCPVCSQNIGSGDKVLVDYRNEGGLQQGLDILPMLREEAYLSAYPDERKCRAFLELCREGDHRAVADLLNSGDESADEDDEMTDDSPQSGKTIHDILRYQDPMADMQSGLHAAVANGSREVAWLLLLLASNLSEMEFPALVYQEAASLEIMRSDQTGKIDIRSLKDTRGRTAEDIAKEAGVVWNGWIGNKRLALD